MTGPCTFRVRPATAGDVDAILGLRAEAEEWLRSRGIRQWTPDYDAYARTVLRDAVDAGTAWVVDDRDGVVIATVSLNGPDPDFWSPDDDPDTGLYLGKMIVARRYAGQDLGDALMNWAGARAARSGKRWLRLDCRRDNLRLHNYYLDRGFEHVRTVVPAGRRTESGALFQREAGVATAARSRVDEAG